MEEMSKPNYLRYGGSTKSTDEMTHEELEIAAQAILRRAKEKAFSKGLPIYSAKDGMIIAEYSDGHTEVAKRRSR